VPIKTQGFPGEVCVNKRLWIICLVSVLIFGGIYVSVCPAQNSAVGIVALHGKGSAAGNSWITPLVLKLTRKGFIVLAPEMPYSKYRNYDRSYEDTMPEIDNAVKELKQRGAKKIFIAGHSLGANVALHYATLAEIDGILAVAPGHRPEAATFWKTTQGSVFRARQMVKEGKGDQRDIFTDTNQGKISSVEMSAAAYLSWFDPEGPAFMPRNVRAMKPNTALLWVVGRSDPIYDAGPQYAFNLAPPNMHNKYLVLNSNHTNTPADAAEEIIAWLLEF
jgi:predicted alpha/beta-hydrolase family hydrolase